MINTKTSTKNNQKRICEEILEPIKNYIPFRYTQKVTEKLEQKGVKVERKDYIKRKIQQVKAGKNYDVIIAKAIKEVAEEYKELVNA